MPPHDKELRHVEDARGAGQAAALVHEREAGDLAVDAPEKRMAPRIDPIGRERPILEAPVALQLEIDQLAEVVRVELHQVHQHRLILGARRLERDLDRVGHLASESTGISRAARAL
jgi:hypothetical protein